MNKIDRVNRNLMEAYGIEISETSKDNLEFIRDNYLSRKADILSSSTLQEAVRNPQYVKAVMISEAAKVILREIAPSRTRNRRRKK